MNDQIRAMRQSDEEEEDLENLRLVALKSIHVKKEVTSYQQSPPQLRNTHHSAASYTIPITQRGVDNGVSPTSSPQYYPVAPHNMPIQPRPIPNPLDNFNTRQRLEQLDLSEPYVPQRVPPIATIGPPPVAANGWIPEAVVNNTYAPYIPHKLNDAIPVGVNVQLSPRSMAFVAQNNDILMRRKGENISPNYAYRSLSPPYRNVSPGRWSKSPSPQIPPNNRSPVHRNRPHQYSHRRSMSRSPPPLNRPRSPPMNRPRSPPMNRPRSPPMNRPRSPPLNRPRSPPLNRPRSPFFRRRSISRSPPPVQQISRHPSPNPFHRFPSRSPPPQIRRAKSRSPMANIFKHKLSPRRHISRSPQPLLPRNGGRPLSRSPPALFNARRRSPPLLQRHGNKIRRTPSPHNMKRSPGNMIYECVDAARRNQNRGRSPQQMAVHRRSSMSPRQRSHSRSPSRKYLRRSRDRAINTNQPTRRRSPYINGRRRYEGQQQQQNGLRNRGRKRSLSPSNDKQKKSRSKSPERNRRNNKRPRRPEHDNRRVDDSQRNDLKSNNDNKNTKKSQSNESIRDVEELIKTKPLSSTPPPLPTLAIVEEKSIRSDVPSVTNASKKPEEKSQESGPLDEKDGKDSSDDDDDGDDDGIDLFASEESESENEGRFKSRTSKNERDIQAPTLSFTKLGENVPVAVKALTDIGQTNNRSNNDNAKNDRHRARNNYGRSRADHFRNTDSNRNSRNDRRKNNSKNIRRDRNRDWDSSSNSKGDEKKGDDKPMFKSTFQAVENEGRSSRKNSRERDLSDRKSSNSNSSKRRNNSKDRKVSPETDMNFESVSSAVTIVSSSAIATTSSSSPSRSLNDASGKKPIHLRLGAMTNTFKPPKKTSTWNSTTSSEKV